MNDVSTPDDQRLATGWDPGTPIADTIVRQLIHTVGEETTSVVAALGGDTTLQDGWFASDLGRPAAFYNGMILRQPLTAETTRSTLAAAETFFFGNPAASGMVVLFSPWPTPDLRTFGWTLMGHPPAHVRPAGGAMPPDPPGVTIRKVDTAELLHDWERAVIGGYFTDLAGGPPGQLSSPKLLADTRHRCWVASVDGEVAGASAAVVAHGIVYVSVVATIPAFRGRGIGAALTWHATLADPALPATLLSSDEGRPLYDRMGYLAITRFTVWYRLRGK